MNSNKVFSSSGIFICACLFVLLCWVGNWRLYEFVGSDSAGAIGSIFGVTNTLFSGLAFAALIVSIRMQNEELKLQREELKANRKELKQSREAQEYTAKQLEEQTLIHFVTLKYQTLDVFQKSLPNRIDELRQKLINEFIDSVKENPAYYIQSDPNSKIMDNRKVELESRSYYLNHEEYKKLKKLEENLEIQKNELDLFMRLENPDTLKLRIVNMKAP